MIKEGEKPMIKKLLITLLVLPLIHSPVLAEEKTDDTGITIDVPVEIKDGGTAEITADPGSPKSNEDVITVNDTGEFKLYFDRFGNYSYNISQIKGDNEHVTYDETIYKIKIFYGMDEHGQDITETVLYKTNENVKSVKAAFFNIVYEPVPGDKDDEKKPPSDKTPPSDNPPSDTNRSGSNSKTGTGFPVRETAAGVGALIVLIGLLLRREMDENDEDRKDT